MHRIILSSAACQALPYFSTLSNKRHGFRKNVLNIKCVLWVPLQLLSEEFTFLRTAERDIIINVQNSACKVPVILVRCSWHLNFLYSFFPKKVQISRNLGSFQVSNIKFHKNPCSASRVVLCGRTDGQTDRQTQTQTDRQTQTHTHDENSSFLLFFESAQKMNSVPEKCRN